MSTIDPRSEEIAHDINVDQVYEDSRSNDKLQLIYIDGNVYVFQRPDKTHRFGSREEFTENVAAGRFSLLEEAEPFAATSEPSDEEKQLVQFEDLDGIGEQGAENLREAGFETVRDVRAASDEDLLDVSWVGEKGVASIRDEV